MKLITTVKNNVEYAPTIITHVKYSEVVLFCRDLLQF